MLSVEFAADSLSAGPKEALLSQQNGLPSSSASALYNFPGVATPLDPVPRFSLQSSSEKLEPLNRKALGARQAADPSLNHLEDEEAAQSRIQSGFEPLTSPMWDLEGDAWASLLGEPSASPAAQFLPGHATGLLQSRQLPGRSQSYSPVSSGAEAGQDSWSSDSSRGSFGPQQDPHFLPPSSSDPVAPGSRIKGSLLADHVRQVVLERGQVAPTPVACPDTELAQAELGVSSSASMELGEQVPLVLSAVDVDPDALFDSPGLSHAAPSVVASGGPYAASSGEALEGFASSPELEEWTVDEIRGMLGLDASDTDDSLPCSRSDPILDLDPMMPVQVARPSASQEPKQEGSESPAATNAELSVFVHRRKARRPQGFVEPGGLTGSKRGASEAQGGPAEGGAEDFSRGGFWNQADASAIQHSPADGRQSPSSARALSPGTPSSSPPPAYSRSASGSAGAAAPAHNDPGAGLNSHKASKAWHRQAAALLLQKGSAQRQGPECSASAQGCPCGMCGGGDRKTGVAPGHLPGLSAGSAHPLVSSRRQQQPAGSPPGVQPVPALVVDENSRPGDLSGRLAAVIGKLGIEMDAAAGSMKAGTEGQRLNSSVMHEDERPVSLEETENMAIVPLAFKGPIAKSKSDAAAVVPGVVAVKSGSLKQDARRKKGRYSGEVPALATGDVLLPSAAPSSLNPDYSSIVALYSRSCDVEVQWHLQPGLSTSALPAAAHGGSGEAFSSGINSIVPRNVSFSSPSVHFPPNLLLGSRPFPGSHTLGQSPAVAGSLLLPGSSGAASDAAVLLEPGHHVRDMLMALAESYATDDLAKVRSLTKKLTKKADKLGSAEQRVAYYFLSALEARAEGTGSAKFAAPMAIPSEELNASMRVLCKVVPFLQANQLVAHEVILDATAGSDNIHLLVLGLWHGDNWAELFRRMVERPGGPPRRVRVTGVDAPCTPGKLAIKLSSANVVLQLKAAAASAGLPSFVVDFLPVPMEKLRPSHVRVEPGETLVSFAAMKLQSLPDGSVVRSSPRDSVLQAVHELKPKSFLLIDVDANFNSPFFLARFKEALGYFGSIFESIEAGAEKGCLKRHMFEESYFARDIINVVACEGLHRVLRPERMEQWADRLRYVGFTPQILAPSIADKLRSLFANRGAEAQRVGFSGLSGRSFQVVETDGGIEIGWCNNRLLFASAWSG